MTQRPSLRPIIASEHRLAERCARGRVVLIDQDAELRAALCALIEREGYACERHPSTDAYLRALSEQQPAFAGPCCLLCDVRIAELDGLALQRRLAASNDTPMLLVSCSSDASEVVSAFRVGALDVLIKPIEADSLLAAVTRALGLSAQRQRARTRHTELMQRLNSLTEREREVARWVAQGQSNREIGESLGIALRTVKLYRHRAMEKLEADTLVDLVRLLDAAHTSEQGLQAWTGNALARLISGGLLQQADNPGMAAGGALLSQEAYQRMINAATSGITLTKDRINLVCNRRLHEMLGYRPSELVGQSTRCLYPDQASWVETGAIIYPLIRRGETARIEVQLLHRDRRLLWVRLSGMAVDVAQPEQGSVWIVDDIHQERTRMEQLRQANRAQQALLDGAAAGIALVKDSLLLHWNRGFRELLGYTPDELLGSSTRLWYPDEAGWRAAEQAAAACVESARPHRLELNLMRRGGDLVRVLASIQRMDLEAGGQGLVWSFFDPAHCRPKQ